MPDVSVCPDGQDLRRLLLGEMSESDAEHLEQHFAGCDRCAQLVSKLKAEDTLVDAMRSQATAADQPEKEAVEKLIGRLKVLQPAGANPVQENTVALAEAAAPAPVDATQGPS